MRTVRDDGAYRNRLALVAAAVGNIPPKKAMKEAGVPPVPRKPSETGVDFNGEYNFSEEEIKEMVELKEEEVSYREIAEKFGVSKTTIRSRVMKYKDQ